MTKNATHVEMEEAVRLETYLSKYKPTGWNNPLSDFCDIPGINPTNIKDMREYFKSNSELNLDKDSKTIAALQPALKFLNQPCLEKYIEALRAYFTEHPDEPNPDENKESPDITKHLY